MTPVPAVAARNTNIVAEGETKVTNEELQQITQKISDELDKLYNSEKPLTKKEKRHRQILSLQKQTLQQIKEARQKGDAFQERDLTITYGLLTSLGKKHPFLASFLRTKFRWNVY